MSNSVISVDQLAVALNDHNTIVVDCRFSLADTDEGERHYQLAHIEGAHYLHLDKHLSGEKGTHGGRHPLPSVADLEVCLQNIGINKDTMVVAYDDQRFAFASRLWWLLRYLGHENVKVLEGGFAAWQRAELPVNNLMPEAVKGDFFAVPRDELLVDIQDVRNRKPETVLIDSREAPRFEGISEPIDPIAGHIEGAVNFPWQTVADEDTGSLVAKQQHDRWADVKGADELMVYCGSGVTACVNLLSLAQAGRDDAKLYAGSWSDWCSYMA